MKVTHTLVVPDYVYCFHLRSNYHCCWYVSVDYKDWENPWKEMFENCLFFSLIEYDYLHWLQKEYVIEPDYNMSFDRCLIAATSILFGLKSRKQFKIRDRSSRQIFRKRNIVPTIQTNGQKLDNIFVIVLDELNNKILLDIGQNLNIFIYH